MKKGLTVAGLLLAAQMAYTQPSNTAIPNNSVDVAQTIKGGLTEKPNTTVDTYGSNNHRIEVVEAGIGDIDFGEGVKSLTDFLGNNPHYVYFAISLAFILMFGKRINDKAQKPLINLGHSLGATAGDLASTALIAGSVIMFLKEPLGITDEQMRNFFAMYGILTITPWVNNYCNGNAGKRLLKMCLSGGTAYLMGGKSSEIYAAIDKHIDAEHVGGYLTIISLGTLFGLNNNNGKELTKLILALVLGGYLFGDYVEVDVDKVPGRSSAIIELNQKPGGFELIHKMWTRFKINPVPGTSVKKGVGDKKVGGKHIKTDRELLEEQFILEDEDKK